MFDEPKGAWEILPAWRAALNDRRYDLLDRAAIEAFLRRFLSDYRVVSNMRHILTASEPVSRFTDDQLVETISWKLATKELVISQAGKKDVAPPSDGGGGDGKDKKKASVQPDNIKPAPPPPPPGNLQVTVLDDKGRGVANVAVNGPSVKKTDGTGKALWQGLAPGSYNVTVNTPLPEPANKDLYLPAPEVPAKTAVVPSGGTAALIFHLKRKPSPTIAVAAPKILLVKQEYNGKDKPPLMQPIVPHRISVKLGLIEDYDGVGELTFAPADVRVFEKQDDKTEKPLPWQIPAADLKAGKTVWIEGKNPSASLEGTVAKLSLKNGTIPPKVVDATDKFTCVLLQLDIYHARAEDKSEPFAVPRILRIDTGGLTVVHDPSKHLFAQRLKLVVSRAKPADYKGKLVVKPVNASVQAFDKEAQAAGDKPLTADQLKFVNTKIDAAKGQILWNQGVTQSTGPADTGWTVETEDVPGKEGDRIMLTVLTIALSKIETTDITDSSKWEADDDFSPTLSEKAKVYVQVKPSIKVNNVQLRIDFGRLNKKPKGADPLVNGSFTLVSRAEHAYPMNKDHFEYEWNGKSTVAAAQEFSNRTTTNVNGGTPNIPLPAIASGANIPHGLYFIDQICLLQSNGILGRLRPEDIDLSVPMLANLTYNGNWAADLAAFGLTPFQSDIEKALLRFGGRDYMIRDASLANRINVRFIANTGISNALSIRSSIGGPDPANNGLFGSTPDGPAPLSDNLYTFNEGLSSDITIFPSTFLDFNNTANVADQTTFRGIFAPLGVAPAQNTGAPGTATARAVDAAGKVTGGTTAADDQGNVTVALDADGMATVTSTNPAKVPAARASEIQAALRAFVHFTGNTINHETAHGLGVAARVKANNKITISGTTVTSPLDGDAGAHNKVTANTNIVDAGSTRSFPRRIEAAGLPQQKFSAVNTRYLRDCIPFDQHDN